MKTSNLLRKIYLLPAADKAYYYWQRLKNKKDNKKFLKENPDIKLPPDYLMFESFQINYRNYIHSGRLAAEEILTRIAKYNPDKNIRILDWGCGPGRIIRHMPDLLGKNSEVFGTDYNTNSITWCRNNLPKIKYNNNSLKAELPYENDFFDVLYGISIFTHLSEKMHYEWIKELYRVLKPNGLMYLTFQGDNYLPKLDSTEQVLYRKGELVVRGNVSEGHRTYSAVHPPQFLEKLFHHMEIIEQIVQKPVEGWIPQDVWIVRK